MPDEGSIHFAGQSLERDSLPELRQRMGYVIQDGGLFPHLSARDNVALALLHVLKQPRDQAHALALQSLEQVGLADRAGAALRDATIVVCATPSRSAVSIARSDGADTAQTIGTPATAAPCTLSPSRSCQPTSTLAEPHPCNRTVRRQSNCPLNVCTRQLLEIDFPTSTIVSISQQLMTGGEVFLF